MATKQTRLTPFGRKVRKRLIDKNMTQVELAALLGCNKQYMREWLLHAAMKCSRYMELIEGSPGMKENIQRTSAQG